MTQPTAPSLDTDEQLSGRAVDAVAEMHGELQRRYTGLNAAETQLAEALLAAHATSETGRRRLQDIQHQLVEAISNPVNALDTPAGERQFLVFLRSKVAEIQRIVDQGALTSHDQADVTNALANGYFGPDAVPMPAPPGASGATPPVATAPPSAPVASMAPPIGGQPSSPPMAPGAGLLPAAAAPLSGLASLLGGDSALPQAGDTPVAGADEHAPLGSGHHDKHAEPKADDEDRKPDDEEDTKPSSQSDDAPPDDALPDNNGPAQTRPADG